MFRPALFLLATALLAPQASAWGVLGHRLVAQASLKDLPPGPAAWFAGLEATLPDHASDPDQWKERDPQERPHHYLNCEPYGGPSLVPLDETAARAQLGPDLFTRSGSVPWTILDRVQRLTRAFQAGDAPGAALEASILSHYVGDISVPLHTTLNHDGDLTGQHGVHHRWESDLLKRIEDNEGWVPEMRPATLGPAPQAAPWAWLRESFNLVPGLLADDMTAEQANAKTESMSQAYWQVFLQLQGPHVKEQCSLAAQRTAQMILLAWTQAGSPPAPAARRSRP